MKKETEVAAFSLIELLVVVTIIAILGSMATQGVRILRENGKSATCANNLRQWSVAMSSYLDDNRGVFPSDGTQNASGSPTVGRPDAWFNVLPEYLGMESMASLAQKGKAPAPSGMKSFFVCPSAAPNPTLSSKYASGAQNGFYSSYALNYWLNAPKSGGILTQRMRLTQIKNPVAFVIFSESADGLQANVHPSTMVTESGADAFRHRGSANMAFGDGHVTAFPRRFVFRDGMTINDNAGNVQWNPENDNIK